MISRKNTLYLPNLNALRFIAASMVLVHHIEYTKLELNLPNWWSQYPLGLVGDLGVTLFFTLSGFLITLLLLEEKKKGGSINVFSFYKRRILRIWPLYYLIFITALLIVPYFYFFNLPTSYSAKQAIGMKLILFVCMLPNVIFSFYPRLPYAVQTWSIGVEEQFYIIWPWLIKFSKNSILLLLMIYLGFIALNILLKARLIPPFPFSDGIFHLISHLRFGCMAIGGAAASIYFNKQSGILKYILGIPTQIFALACIMVLFLMHDSLFQMHEFFSLFFALLILNFAVSPRVLVNLEIKPFKYLGKISYGIYMYQFITIVIAIKFAQFLIGYKNYVLFNLLLYPLAFGLTFGLSSCSYEFFERRFLKFKEKFQIVPSTS